MVIKGAARRNVAFWSRHLQDEKGNTRVELVDSRGLETNDNLKGMMLEMMEDARFSRAKNFMYIASFNPKPEEVLSREDLEKAIGLFEKERGIPEGQQRIIVEHEKNGRTHWHVIWNRIDLEQQKAFSDAFDAKVCERAELAIEEALGLEKTPKFYNRDPELPPPVSRPKYWEQKKGADEVEAQLTALYRESQHGADFVNALDFHGYQLVQGDSALMVLDPAGNDHGLARRLEGVSKKTLKAFLADVDLSHLPTIDAARAKFQQQKIADLAADRETIHAQIEWEEALHKAGVEKGNVIEFDRNHVVGVPGVATNDREAANGNTPPGPALDNPFAGLGMPISLNEVERLRSAVDERNREEAALLDNPFADLGTPISKEEFERLHGEVEATNAEEAFEAQREPGHSFTDFIETLVPGEQEAASTAEAAAAIDNPFAELGTSISQHEFDRLRQNIEAINAEEAFEAQREPGHSFENFLGEELERERAAGHVTPEMEEAFEGQRSSGRSFADFEKQQAADREAAAAMNASTEEAIDFAIGVTVDSPAAAAPRPSPRPKDNFPANEDPIVWMAGRGGFKALNSEHQQKARESYEKYKASGRHFSSGLEGYVAYVQKHYDGSAEEFRSAATDLTGLRKVAKAAVAVNEAFVTIAGMGISGGLSIAGKILDDVADGFQSLFSPTLTPQQKVDNETARQTREAEAQHSIDFTAYIAQRATEDRQQQHDREADRQRERDR